MEPFDSYPGNGKIQLGRLAGNNCRHEYCRQLVFDFEAEPKCAYCGLYLLEPYEHWLLLTVDHVIPQRLVKKGNKGGKDGLWVKKVNEEQLKELSDWINDAANCVVCCSACNGFLNQFPSNDYFNKPPQNWEQFLAMRDGVFLAKRDHAIMKHREERKFWNHKWRCPIIHKPTGDP